MRISWWFTEIAHQIKQSEYDTNVEGDGRKEEEWEINEILAEKGIKWKYNG